MTDPRRRNPATGSPWCAICGIHHDDQRPHQATRTAVMDGSRVNHPKDTPFYEWTVLTADDADGNRWWFHVPTVALIEAAPREASEGLLRRTLMVIEQLSEQANVDTSDLQAALRGLRDDSEGHPGEPHEFRTVCRVCGENGNLNVAIITDLEFVKVEPREAAT